MLVAAGVLLTGCGGDAGNSKESTSGGKATAEASESVSTSGGSGGGATHEVTLEVSGEGTTQVIYHAESVGSGQQTLPWTKTETVELTEAERTVGYRLVTVVPGSITKPDGTLQQAPCVIKVDGKKVTDNNGGKSSGGCTFRIY
ncbi:hypothetical protein ACFU53_19770 [Streptomyces sp. NPDC057474]|uniref:hypothetical protein n=1 Tax=Streptomyces sp. NPDC057474 TaxID=3346144 RepID=UPI00369E8112